ncbi:hypothetical protein P3746_23030 [Vibrio parahaemolyticus]|nr:hypothetical protein [Vibrio parahaemolyticus]MDF4588083.1 hypothetical protein [Vibrio parahaemolyticus]MDF5601291.1 hypothetical protein [Vibrio parahaemolyticus]
MILIKIIRGFIRTKLSFTKVSSEYLEDVTFSNAELSYVSFDGVYMSGMYFEDTILMSSSFGSHVYNSQFIKSTLTNVEFWKMPSYKGMYFGHVDNLSFIDSELTNVQFRGIVGDDPLAPTKLNLDNTSFINSELNHPHFEHVVFKDVIFTGSEISNLNIGKPINAKFYVKESNIDKVFKGSSLENIDFSDIEWIIYKEATKDEKSSAYEIIRHYKPPVSKLNSEITKDSGKWIYHNYGHYWVASDDKKKSLICSMFKTAKKLNKIKFDGVDKCFPSEKTK